MRTLRGLLAISLGIGLVGLVFAFAWLTHHPDHPVVHRLRGWPVVGHLAGWIHRTYATPAGDADTIETQAPSTEPEVQIVEPRGIVDAKPWAWVKPGMRLHRAPSADSPVIAIFDVYANLPRQEVRDGWERVVWHGHDGWLPPPSDVPRLGRAPDPPGPLAPRPADPDRLARALALLGEDAIARPLGPYTLYSDSANTFLIDRLARLAAQLDAVYAERFGRQPVGTPRETVILFERESDYRQLQAASKVLAGLNAAGHTGWGLAALYRADRDMDDVAATFVHEISHLMNRRAIGPALPPWLDEGLAEALASGRIQPWGTIEPREWGGFRRQIGQRTELSGVRAAHLRLIRAIDRESLPTLEALVALDAEQFMRGESETGSRYTTAGLFIRFLLDADDARRAPGFRGFLDDVAEGRAASGEALLERLGTTWQALDARFRAWVLEAEGL